MNRGRKRRTIKKEIFFEGFGVHSGLRSSVKIIPGPEKSGLCFSFWDRVYRIGEAQTDGSGRSSALLFPGGERIRTVEHLLAAIVGVGIDDAIISAEGEELPILDGSALTYASGLLSAGFEEYGSDFVSPRMSFPVCISSEGASIAAIPWEGLRVTYVIDYPGTSIGTEMKDVIINSETFMAEVAPARTFCLLSEVEHLRKSGLGLGGDAERVLVMGDGGSVGSEYRIERECVSHKITDLLGDLALAGFVADAHYVCVRGGHWLHAKLANRLKRCVLADLGRY